VRDPKAILYNDRAVLEMHHVAQAYSLLNKDENNIFSSLSPKDYTQIRKIIIELVLATDLGAHFDFLAQFKSSVSSGSLDSTSDKLVGPNAYANRLMIHKMALKCGDLGHSCKTLNLHEKWTHRISEEFYRQGDEERKRNIAISPFMVRHTNTLAAVDDDPDVPHSLRLTGQCSHFCSPSHRLSVSRIVKKRICLNLKSVSSSSWLFRCSRSG
jgi:hypothetical protein